MNIVICGAGDVGRHSAEVLGPAGHDITIIDRDPKRLAVLDDVLDVRSLAGVATHGATLVEAGVHAAELVIAATSDDEVNLIAASVAKGLGAKQAIARVHHSAYFTGGPLDYGEHLGVDHLVCPEATTAQAIASTLRSPGAVAVESFARGRLEMQSFPVTADAKGVGKPLSELKLPGARLAAVSRNSEPFLPDGQTKLQAGDFITLIGDAKSFDKTRKLFDTEAGARQHTMIMGGSSLAVWLCRALRHSNISIKLFEPNMERAEELAQKLSWVTVLNEDIIQSDALEDERVDLTNAFVAVTDEDERNLLAAARAKSMKVKKAFAVLQRGTYQHLVAHLGIDKSFSPRESAVVEMLRRIETGPLRPLGELIQGVAEVYEAHVGEAAGEVLNRPLRGIALPDHCSIAAIQRGDRVYVPGGDDQLQVGDHAVILSPGSERKALRKIFGQ